VNKILKLATTTTKVWPIRNKSWLPYFSDADNTSGYVGHIQCMSRSADEM